MSEEPDALGLCLFGLNLQSDLGVEQSPVQSFSLDVASGFTAVTPQFGTPTSNGGLDAVAASQNCDGPAVLGVGLPGKTMIARGELRMPATPGQYTVRVTPFQIQLIGAEGGGEMPQAVSGGTLSITVGEAEETADGEGQDGTDGAPGAGGDGDAPAPPAGDGGTGGIGGDGTTGGADGTGIDADSDTNGTGTISSQPITGEPVSAEPASGGLCGFGMLGAALYTLIGLLGLRTVRQTTS